jgi:hypothetical protein
MLRPATVLLFVVASCAAVGCRGTAQPQLFGPGSAQQQQHQAQQFDPYPETDVGPSVEGGRPEGYTTPAPEATRGTTNRWTMPWFGR